MSWPTVALGDICKPKQHKTIPSSELLEEGFVVYGANGPIGFYSNFTHDRTTIAVTCRGATCGTINVVPPQSYITGNAMALDDLNEDKVDLRFLKYALEHKGFASVINGAAQPQITRAPLLTYTIPLPPLEEQKRIAEILDQADALRRISTRALDKLNTLGQAIFLEMFGKTEHDFSEAILGEVCDVRDGTHDSPKYVATGYPLLTSKNFTTGKLSFEGSKLISEADYLKINKRSKVDLGDIVMPMIGTIGSPVVIEEEPSFAIKNVALIKFFEGSPKPSFVQALLSGPYLQRIVKSQGRGGTQKFISLGDLRKLRFPLPQKEQQETFEGLVDEIRTQRSKLSHLVTMQEALFASLQHRAFRGEL